MLNKSREAGSVSTDGHSNPESQLPQSVRNVCPCNRPLLYGQCYVAGYCNTRAASRHMLMLRATSWVTYVN